MYPTIPGHDLRLERIARDEEGYLPDASDWNPPLVGPLAAESGPS
jgi:sulfur relay (sulfurtransferase) DsrC/TusE family protein